MNRRLLAGAAALAVTAGLAAATPARAAGTPVHVLLAGNRIVTVSTAAPAEATADVVVTGLAAGESLVGIDRRPNGGAVYAVARSASATRAYTVDSATGAATLAFTLVTTAGAPVVLQGNDFGVDFNPAADALRITSDAGQNLRALPSTRIVAGVERPIGTTFVDSTLSYQPITDPARTAATGIAASAYTNNVFPQPATTTLYNLDTALDGLTRQVPPNDGTQVAVGPLSRGTTSAAGFDIVTVDGVDTAYAALTQEQGKSQVARLFVVDLATGEVTELGALGKYRAPLGIAL